MFNCGEVQPFTPVISERVIGSNIALSYIKSPLTANIPSPAISTKSLVDIVNISVSPAFTVVLSKLTFTKNL